MNWKKTYIIYLDILNMLKEWTNYFFVSLKNLFLLFSYKKRFFFERCETYNNIKKINQTFTIKKKKRHPYHLVTVSPWPIYISLSLGILALEFIGWINHILEAKLFALIIFNLLIVWVFLMIEIL